MIPENPTSLETLGAKSWEGEFVLMGAGTVYFVFGGACAFSSLLIDVLCWPRLHFLSEAPSFSFFFYSFLYQKT